eukprot:TRINITY_DN21379_c0_g1_i1.p1 TRINITY_DN21379_c0_g1~~TRINITY_DN21379_c0_g1_i1.p1  ORF type:complete len:102 (-),score=4.40 TRINITY_DN21379_c0_g1_i1:28-333(-)
MNNSNPRKPGSHTKSAFFLLPMHLDVSYIVQYFLSMKYSYSMPAESACNIFAQQIPKHVHFRSGLSNTDKQDNTVQHPPTCADTAKSTPVLCVDTLSLIHI